jgi:hypothetical protein
MLLDVADRDLVIDAFRTGARGVFTRAHSFSALPRCISAVYRGEVWVSNAQIELLLELIMRIRPLHVVKPGAIVDTPGAGYRAAGCRRHEERGDLTEA